MHVYVMFTYNSYETILHVMYNYINNTCVYYVHNILYLINSAFLIV